MEEVTLKTIVDEVIRRTQALENCAVRVEHVEHGYGWEPTVAFNNEDRRVHFYFDFYSQDRLTAEVSCLNGRSDAVRRTPISTTEEAWIIIHSFLCQQCALEDLPMNFQWEHGAHGQSH